jgi:hypothetical protein
MMSQRRAVLTFRENDNKRWLTLIITESELCILRNIMVAKTAMKRQQSPEESSSRDRLPTLATMMQARALPPTWTHPRRRKTLKRQWQE